ncbi:MAG: MBL fold metallo-hydrolase [Candidatus Promineifilaceae bacterium]|nr:MBL fold metallo-hydrolase [Candidatus Promineifilaceae bacterium]
MAVAEPDTATAVPSRSAEQLYEDLLSGRQRFILDVRNQEEFERWRVEGRTSLRVKNVPYFSFIEDADEAVAQVPTGEDVLVVCAKEGSSEFVADILRQNGIEASYLEEGILSWGNLYDVRDVVDEPFGRIVQVARPARGDLSFVVVSDGQAAIVDPLRHIDHYLNVVDAAGARVTHIFDTHAHADHISGGPALHQATGAPYYMHPYDAIHPLDMLPGAIDYAYLQDGQTFQVGQFTARVIWFPGHTLGQVNYLLSAPSGQRYLFSGDGIFLRSFGRPDLGGQAEAWTPILYESLYERLPPHLDGETVILPAHFSTLDEGTEHGTFAAGTFAAPYAQVKEQNRGLRPRSLEEFTEYVLGNLPAFPDEYVEIKRVNAGLVQPTEEEAEELELGKNICALADA